jgi:hypothetical protein
LTKMTNTTCPRDGETASTFGVEQTLEDGKSVNRAWSRAQLEILGVAWPPVKGWKAELIRQKLRLSREQHDEFVAIRKVV